MTVGMGCHISSTPLGPKGFVDRLDTTFGAGRGRKEVLCTKGTFVNRHCNDVYMHLYISQHFILGSEAGTLLPYENMIVLSWPKISCTQNNLPPPPHPSPA